MSRPQRPNSKRVTFARFDPAYKPRILGPRSQTEANARAIERAALEAELRRPLIPRGQVVKGYD